MKTMNRPFALCSVLGALIISATGLTTAHANDKWPSKPITYVVPFAPGGATDIVGRTYSQMLTDELGVPVVVENKPGTGGSLGSAYASRAAADGYTIVGGTISSHSINVSIYPSIGYDPVKSFTPIIMTGTLPNVLVVRADSNLKSVQDVINRARKEKDGVSFGSSGVGSSQHLAGELFAGMIGAKMLHVPYKGSSPSLQALVAGDIDILFDNLTSAMPLIQGGQLRALAVTSKTADAALPNVKPLHEQGLEGYEVVSWQASFAPAGTPPAVVDKLYKAMHAALQKPEVKERFASLGLTISGAGPQELGAFQKAEVEKWAKVVREANIKLN